MLATASEGPAMRVVPVSIAANASLLLGVTVFPFTVIAIRTKKRGHSSVLHRRHASASYFYRRTRNTLQPIAGCRTAGEVLEVDVAGEQGGVGASEGQDSSGLFVGGLSVVQEPREEDGHFWARELVVVDESLPERDGAGGGDCLECEAHDTGDGAVNETRCHLVHDN